MKYLGAITDDNHIATKKYVDDHAGGGDTVTASAQYNSGTKIATITINGSPVDIYVPVYGGGVS